MRSSKTLLVNYWYAHPVGHALEGMRYALGYKTANPHLRVSLLLNGASAVELRRKALEEGMIGLRQSGLQKIREGITTIEEVVRETVL